MASFGDANALARNANAARTSVPRRNSYSFFSSVKDTVMSPYWMVKIRSQGLWIPSQPLKTLGQVGWSGIHNLKLCAADAVPPWKIDDDGSGVSEGFHWVSSVWRNDHRTSRTSHPILSGDFDLKLAIDDVPDFVVWMRMLLNPRTRCDSIVRERHVSGMKESAFPPCSWLLYVKMVRVNECHGGH